MNFFPLVSFLKWLNSGSMLNDNFMFLFYLGLWWVGRGWLPGAHQTTLSLPVFSGIGGESRMKNSWVEIKAVE